VRLLGVPSVAGPSGRRPIRGAQPRLVLAYLLLEQRPVLRDELAGVLWPERRLPDHWAGAVRGVVARLRSELVEAGWDPGCLTTDGGIVTLTPPPDTPVDVWRADELVAEARRARDAADPAAGAARAAEASRILAAGPLLPEHDGDWVRRQRERCDGLGHEAARLHAASLLGDRRPDEAARLMQERVGDDPLDEAAHHLLIAALIAGGRRPEAVQAFARLRTVLDEELGISPTEATAALVAPARGALPAPASSPEPRRSAGATRAAARPPFVGRVGELERIAAAWDRVVAGEGTQVVVVEGPSGIGKTHLAEVAAERLAPPDRILRGRCRPGTDVAFAPVVGALVTGLAPRPEVLERLGPQADGLADLLPEVVPARSVPRPADPDVARGVVFRSVAATVAALADAPTVWVVDDLQWASTDTLELLEWILDDGSVPLLVLATLRGTAPEARPALARIGRRVGLHAVELAGLSEEDLLALVAAHERPDVEVGALHRRSGGHPLLATELVRAGEPRAGDPAAASVPEEVRAWIGRRIAGLPRPDRDLLELAATIGADAGGGGARIDLSVLARCSSEGYDQVLDRCEGLVEEGFLVEGEQLGQLAFAHEITRDAVDALLGADRRARLHARIAAAVADEPAGPGRSARLLAHLRRAGPAARPLAAAHAVAAGAEAMRASAWDLASDHFATAVELADGGDARLRARALLGATRVRQARGEVGAADALVADALALARAAGLAVEQAEAALLLAGRSGRSDSAALADDQRVTVLGEALERLTAAPPAPPALTSADDEGVAALDAATPDREQLAVELEGELALALLLTDAAAERRATAAGSLARVRRAAAPAPAVLARAVLNARLAQVEPHLAATRRDALDEVLAHPPGSLPPELELAALCHRHEEHLVLGDRARARDDLAAATALADRYQHRYWQWVAASWGALALLVDGELAEAEAAAVAAAGLADAGQAEPAACLGVTLVAIRLLQGRADEVVDLLAGAVESAPSVPCYRAVLALCRMEAGDAAGARTDYGHFARASFANLPDDTNRFLGLAVLAEVATALGDGEGAAVLDEALAPSHDLHVVLNCYGGGGAYWGPVAHQRARLAALAGRPDDARRAFEAARRRAAEVGAPVVAARIERDEARWL